MNDTKQNAEKLDHFRESLRIAGLGEHIDALKGGAGAVRLQHVMMLKERAKEGPKALEAALEASGVRAAEDRKRLAAWLLERGKGDAGFRLKELEEPSVPSDSEAWREAAAGEDGALPEGIEEAHANAKEGKAAPGMDAAGERWPPGMKIVHADQAHSIRAQGMIQEPNHYGYIHLAAEIERPRLLKGESARKRSILASVKKAAAELCRSPKVQRADVFTATVIPPGSKEGREVIRKGGYDVHIAEFDVVVLVECPDVETAREVRQSEAFGELEALLHDAARFVHCVTASNPKRIAEVDHDRDGVFLFNYFFAADIAAKGAAGLDILLGVWEYTAGWWTAKANLTNSTPLQPLPGELSSYSLINHCRWDHARDVIPALIFRPTLDSFVLGNFTANDIMAMPILYKLA